MGTILLEQANISDCQMQFSTEKTEHTRTSVFFLYHPSFLGHHFGSLRCNTYLSSVSCSTVFCFCICHYRSLLFIFSLLLFHLLPPFCSFLLISCLRVVDVNAIIQVSDKDNEDSFFLCVRFYFCFFFVFVFVLFCCWCGCYAELRPSSLKTSDAQRRCFL